MAPLIALVASFALFALLGAIGVHAFAPWPAALRYALLVMFALTASAHFTARRADLVRMVPPAFPAPALLVTLTGILEVAGALGLLVASLRLPAAWALTVLLLALLPANIYAARAGLTLNGKPVTPLVPRLALQVLFLAAILVAGYA
jgi:uncharacterized membrane protein